MTTERTEAHALAVRAWELMLVKRTPLNAICGGGPMPAGVALDMVQDATGERAAAVAAVFTAAGEWLAARLSRVADPDATSGSRMGAVAAVAHVLGGQPSLAEDNVARVREVNQTRQLSRLFHPRAVSAAETGLAADYLRWVNDAARALEACREVEKAA